VIVFRANDKFGFSSNRKKLKSRIMLRVSKKAGRERERLREFERELNKAERKRIREIIISTGREMVFFLLLGKIARNNRKGVIKMMALPQMLLPPSRKGRMKSKEDIIKLVMDRKQN